MLCRVPPTSCDCQGGREGGPEPHKALSMYMIYAAHIIYLATEAELYNMYNSRHCEFVDVPT